MVISMLIMNNLKYCREEIEMTQEELGNVLGVSRKTVTGWENNHDTMPLPKLIRFCNLYKFSANYVMMYHTQLLSAAMQRDGR